MIAVLPAAEAEVLHALMIYALHELLALIVYGTPAKIK